MARLMLALTAFVVCFAFLNARRISKRSVTATDEQTIVDAHNAKRRAVQSTVGLATNMQQMVWNTELATLAQDWADGCDGNHRPYATRNIAGIPGAIVGENLAMNYPAKNWTGIAIDKWYNEIGNFTYGAPGGVTPGHTGAVVGHFTQVVYAESGQVGCGFNVCTWGTQNWNYYVCNYALGQRTSKLPTPYIKSTTACSACSSNCTDGLCGCSKVCANYATLNVATCTCDCLAGTAGDLCEILTGCTSGDPSYCGSGYTVSQCPIYYNVPLACPNMCEICPEA